MENKLQITQDEINKIENFNLPLLQEAMRQTELKINDENARKERIDKRAYTLLSFFLGLIGIIFSAIQLGCVKDTIVLGLTAIMLMIPTLILFKVLKSRKYSPLGASPKFWLQKEFIESRKNESEDKNTLGYMLTYILYNAQNCISIIDNKILDK